MKRDPVALVEPWENCPCNTSALAKRDTFMPEQFECLTETIRGPFDEAMAKYKAEAKRDFDQLRRQAAIAAMATMLSRDDVVDFDRLAQFAVSHATLLAKRLLEAELE